jgi:hypothetical protein
VPGPAARVRFRRLLPLLLAVSAVAALALPAPASAGSLTKRDRGGVSKKVAKRFHLTKQERRALDIKNVQVTGKNGFGVVVDVHFKGNVERLIGRGHLKRAAIALVLEPKSKRAKSAVIVTQGSTKNQRIRRRTRSKNAGAIRSGRSVKFFIQGGGFSGVKSVKVRALPRAPRAAKRALAAGAEPSDGVEEMTDDEVEEITVGEIAADAIAALLIASSIDPDDLNCGQLAELGNDLEDALDRAHAYADALTEAESELEAEIANTEGERQMQLREQLRQVQVTHVLVIAAGITVDALLSQVDAILEDDCGPPPMTFRGFMRWQMFGPGELVAPDAYFSLHWAQPSQASSSPITAFKIVLPPDGSTNRQVTNYLCPSKLPNGAIETTNASNDTLVCSGGSVALDERFRVNVRMSPGPTTEMGGQLFGQQDGSFSGPFAITGP